MSSDDRQGLSEMPASLSCSLPGIMLERQNSSTHQQCVMGLFVQGKRTDAFNQSKAVAEAIPALSWVVYSGPNCGETFPLCRLCLGQNDKSHVSEAFFMVCCFVLCSKAAVLLHVVISLPMLFQSRICRQSMSETCCGAQTHAHAGL